MSLEDLKRQVKAFPISQIITNYIPLVRKNKYLTVLCPFHLVQISRIVIKDDRGLFKCSTCNDVGDHFSFVQKYKNISFDEAVIECAKILGLNTANYDPPFE